MPARVIDTLGDASEDILESFVSGRYSFNYIIQRLDVPNLSFETHVAEFTRFSNRFLL